MSFQQQLKESLYYNPHFGIFVWRENRGSRAKAGAIAGSHNKSNGYVDIVFDKQKYSAHRLAFMYMDGAFPPNDVDHANGRRADNRWGNLRLCSRQQNLCNKKNQKNNKSGIKGVYWASGQRKWCAQITDKGKRYSVGSFDHINDAEIAINRKREALHGEFFNSGTHKKA